LPSLAEGKVRTLIRLLDTFLRGRYGIFEFDQDSDCLLRIQVTNAAHPINFPSQTVKVGDPILVLHLWNEHLLAVSPDGIDLAWAKTMQRGFVKSLHSLSQYLQAHPELANICAVGGASALFYTGGHIAGVKFMNRLGFIVLPYHSPLGRFGDFWENFYSWMLIYAYNPGDLRYRNFWALQRTEIWMPADELIDRYA
jgi:hypothetical protein